jgi:hypothetical protein
MKIATEDSPEVAQYTHHREVEIITVANTPELNEARDRFQTVSTKPGIGRVLNAFHCTDNGPVLAAFDPEQYCKWIQSGQPHSIPGII